MSDQNNQNPLDEVDEDLLSMIQRWTEETQRVKEAKREQWRPSESDMNKLPRRENPWATDLNHAADRALQDDTVDKLPSLHYSQPQQQPQQAFNRQTDYQPQPEPKHPSESKKVKPMKKRHPFKRFISFLLVFVLIIGVGGYVLAFNVSGKVDRREISDEDRAALFEVNGTTRVTNILLMGVDTQGGGARADTMLLLSIDKVHKKLKLTSFLRDSWLQLANGNSAKLNSAVDQGGPALAMRTVSKSFNVRVDHFVQFSFESF